MDYKVIIVGAGPAGIFSALTLADQGIEPILLLELGKDINERKRRDVNDMLCGWGGAGAYSDGKLTLSSAVGGRLSEYLGEGNTDALIKYVDETYIRFGAPDKIYGTGDEIDDWQAKASLAELRLIPVPVRHLGTERSHAVLKAMRDYLSSRLELKLEAVASSVIADDKTVKGIEVDGERYDCRFPLF